MVTCFPLPSGNPNPNLTCYYANSKSAKFNIKYIKEILMLNLFHGGFGINTNIFETNIINLAAVVGIVVSFVGNNLSALLDDRKKTILSNLEEANQRALEAQEKLNNAKAQLEYAKKKAQEIREEGISRATSEMNTVVNIHSIRLAKLEEFKNETVQFYQQKAFKEAYLYVVSKILTRVRERLNRGLDSTYHVVVNNFYVSRFTAFK
nr:CF0 subunit I of ATP synthase [Chlorogonium euchlorum]